MSDIAVFKELIKATATVSLENCDGSSRKVSLREPPPAGYTVIVHGMPDDDQAIVIKADEFTAPKGIFKNSKHECKRADFVIIADHNEKKVVIYIEMKAGKGGTEAEIIQQLKGAHCFISYCREIGKSFWNNQNFLKDYEYRFVSIREISISKKPTRPSMKTSMHDRPDRMLKITSSKGLQFNRLVGRK
jgi:hypothetical protein